MVWPAIIAGAASLAGGALASKGGVSKNFAGQLRQAYDPNTKYQRAVADAKAAGLHPLFALGTSGSYSPSIGGQTQTGSAMGEGIAQAGSIIGEGMRQQKAAGRQVKMDAAQAQLHALRVEKMGKEIKLDDMELMERASRLAMTQTQSMWGDGIVGGSAEGPPGTKTYPYGTKTGPPLSMTPLQAHPRESMPERIETRGPKGRRMILNPALGMDEAGQADWIMNPWMQWIESFMNRSRWKKRRIKKPYPQRYKRKW